MTTVERERPVAHPPVEHKEEPPVVVPPTPPPKVGGVRWLWWLAAIAAIVIVTTATVLIVEDEGTVYPNTATVGAPGQILEIWDRPAPQAATVPPPRVYPRTETIGPSGTVREIWELPTRYPSLETVGPSGATLEAWERLPVRIDLVTRGLPGAVLEIWDRPEVVLLTTADVPISPTDVPLTAAAADAALMNAAALEVSIEPVLIEVWDRLDVTVPGGTDWLPADVAFVVPTTVEIVTSASLADAAMLNAAALEVSAGSIPIEIWHRADYVGPMPADVVIPAPITDVAASAALADAAMLNAAALEVSIDPVLTEVWHRPDVTVPGGTDWLPTADVALMNVAVVDMSAGQLQHEIWDRSDYTGPTPTG